MLLQGAVALVVIYFGLEARFEMGRSESKKDLQ